MRQDDAVSRLDGKNAAWMAGDKISLKEFSFKIFLLSCAFPRHRQLPHDWPLFLRHMPDSVGGTWQKIRRFWVQLEFGALSFGFADWNWRLIRQQR